MGRVKGTALGGRRSRSIGPNGQRQSGAQKKLVIRRANQAMSERKKAALAEVQRERERLERIIAHQQRQPAMGQAVGAHFAHVTDIALHRQEPEAVEPPAPGVVMPKPEPRTEPVWSVWRAREYLRQGYTLAHTLARSGVPAYALEGIPLDEDGRGLPG